jgi:hypothetical protein
VTRASIGTLVLILALVVRLVVAALVPLHPDEAYYWEWSRHLAAGYFDHPPAIAWFIRGGTLLLGDMPLGVRLFPVLAGFVAGWAIMRAASRLASPTAGDAAALAFVALPVMSGVFVLATPDAPLLVFAALDALGGDLCGAGGFAGFGPLLVDRGGRFAGGARPRNTPESSCHSGCSSACWRQGRCAAFPHAGPYAAVLAAALVFLPVLRWNALHDWSSFRFQLSHGLGGSIDDGAWRRELELLGGQLLLASPVLFGLGALAVKQVSAGRAGWPSSSRVLPS